MLPLPFVVDGAVTNKIKGDNMDIINGYITDENIVRQNEDAYGNILTLNYSRNKYEIHFVECYRKNIDEYDYRDKILCSIIKYDDAISQYNRLFKLWANPKIDSLEIFV